MQALVFLARGRIARQRRAVPRGRGAGAPGDACRLRRPQFLRNADDLRSVPCRRWFFSLADASRAKGALSCAGAAQGRRATLVACVHRP